MESIEQVDEIPIKAEIFIKNIEGKINDYRAENLSDMLGISNSIQWDNVKVNGNKLLIEKSARPFEKFSRYAGISGTIESEIISNENNTILQARITLDTAMAEVMKYILGGVIGLSGLLFLIAYFDFRVFFGLFAIEWFIFWLLPRFHNSKINDLVSYYQTLINEALQE